MATWTTKVDGVDRIRAAHINALQTLKVDTDAIPYVRPEDYGVTSIDATPAIQAAVNALPPTGGSVYFTPGKTYPIYPLHSGTVGVSFATNYISLVSEGRGAIIKVMGDFAGFQITGPDASGDPYPASVYYPYSLCGISLKRLAITANVRGEGFGIKIIGWVQSPRISECSFDKFNAAIYTISAHIHGLKIHDNRFSGNRKSIQTRAILHDFQVCNNKEVGTEEHVTRDVTNWFFWADDGGELYEALIQGNLIEHIFDDSGGSAGIQIDGNVVKVCDVNISGNSFDKCDRGIKWTGDYLFQGVPLSGLVANTNIFIDCATGVELSGRGNVLSQGNQFLSYIAGQRGYFANNLTYGRVRAKDNFFSGYPDAQRYVIGGTSPADVYEVEEANASASVVPAVGTWKIGQIVWNTAPLAAGSPGWVCLTSGTFSAATDNTGDTDGATGIITGMADVSDFKVGDYVTVSAGFPTVGPYKILYILSATSITIDALSNAAVDNITVATPDPTFGSMANLA